ncbi:hypothetical protein [Proteiniphilum sp.]|uniref:hypothetical protein n=1 Tax=Proteiniphilum sp. TaxID=1926877 RepID=UPI002B20396B|nr:hypothetical protein [Proteiniphilum sp.]MEA4915903.1 hypothetical protein [Proteiniphilum sp.]
MQKKEFIDSLNTAVFTTKYVLDNNCPILYVYHYKEDGAWEFLGIEDISEDDYCVVSLEEIINLDPTVLAVTSMRMGYYAERESKNSVWNINKIQ